MTVKTILLLSANPKGTAPLCLEEEARLIKAGLKQAKNRKLFQIERAEAVTARDVQRAMLEYEPQIVHFSGHGTGAPGIILEGTDGNPQTVSSDALADLFALSSDTVECVVLNACYSEYQAQGIAQHIPSVVGMNQTIGDKAAIEYAVSFYDALGAGRPIEFAHKWGCNAIKLMGIKGDQVPRLLQNEKGQPLSPKTDTDKGPTKHLPEETDSSSHDQSQSSFPESQKPEGRHQREPFWPNVEPDEPIQISDRIDGHKHQTEASKAKCARIKREIREFLNSPTSDYDDVVVCMQVLAELIQITEVHFAVITFRVTFQRAYEQISGIFNYKNLHDLLHKLEFQCYNVIVRESARFPNDESSLDALRDYEWTLRDILREIQQIIEQNPVLGNGLAWVEDLECAQHDLNRAIDVQDKKILNRSIWRLNRILAVQPSRINTNLNTSAKVLNFRELVNAMELIWEQLNEFEVHPKIISQFKYGVEKLADLEQSFTAFIIGHDYWQEVDLELRRIEDTMRNDYDFEAFEMYWLDLKEKTEVLFDPHGDNWTMSFFQETRNLDDALLAQNPVKIKRYFRTYRRLAGDRFQRVDITLKGLCEGLHRVGYPLASVLRRLE